jgi:hypothetical protein
MDSVLETDSCGSKLSINNMKRFIFSFITCLTLVCCRCQIIADDTNRIGLRVWIGFTFKPLAGYATRCVFVWCQPIPLCGFVRKGYNNTTLHVLTTRMKELILLFSLSLPAVRLDTYFLHGASVLVELWPPHILYVRFCDSKFVQGGVVSPTPNPQPGGPQYLS